MIETYVFTAKEDIFKRKSTFYEGRAYFGRLSKTGKSLVIKSEEGYWIPFETFELGNGAWNYKLKSELFERSATIYMRSRKRIDEFTSPKDYLENKDNYKKYMFYGSHFRDIQL
ncbi:hypothetical protein PQE68_gp087 [Bacillus phage vB_BanS_Sophrita]|uniref:Uncharacterized protein n=1 Tax=Bacillus phage vB_BanS_Sophrita TaxID=2894790 RepID=A0AAE8YTW7_9CAUD|nr:hypothetical protein PQE68_gp087 [Bacillus phage vB_BanS_Sophrita]UGO50678.1 hypothetical protein SOPHRITA_87 [Bacillus phage vB_BanS_Sophrita]